MGRAIRLRTPRAGITVLAIICAVLPDIDNFIGLIGPELYLLHHRGITHSLPGIAALSALMALLFRRFRSELPDFLPTFLIALAAMGGHVFLDVVTSYGTQLFAPFSDRRFSLDSVFIIDPVFTGLMAVLLALSYSRRRAELARAGIALILLYPMLSLAAREYARPNAEAVLHSQGFSCEKLELVPDAFAPLRWKAIATCGDSLLFFGAGGGNNPAPADGIRSFRRADLSILRNGASRISMFRTWEWFARYPFMETSETGNGGKIVRFGDLQFESTWDFIKKRWNGGVRPFSLGLTLDGSGAMTGWSYTRPGRETVTMRVQ
ncbi:MAG: metal-dependent hydrolase [Nitrospirae bacterium]|nr:metal-dependent hydrolase [Nitrospirota bacterium]